MVTLNKAFILLFLTGYLSGAVNSSLVDNMPVVQTLPETSWFAKINKDIKKEINHGLMAVPAFVVGYLATSYVVSGVAHTLHINEKIFKFILYSRFKHALPLLVGYKAWHLTKKFLDIYDDSPSEDSRIN